MILQALYKLAEREGLLGDPDYEPKPVRWLITVGPGGDFKGIQDTQFTPPKEGKRKPKPQVKSFQVPLFAARTSGDKASFLVDKAEYVLGYDPAGKQKAKRLEKRARLFREWVEDCARTTGDPGARAVADFLSKLADRKAEVALTDDTGPSELFAFIYSEDGEGLVSDRPKVREYWKAQRTAKLAEVDSVQCLVSGKVAPPAPLIPQVKRVPGAQSSGASLVSYNAKAFESHGWDGNENAPISNMAAEGAMTALNRLLNPAYPKPDESGETLPRRNVRISTDTAVCYWTRPQKGDDFADWFGGIAQADPQSVAEVYRSVFRGVVPDVEDPSAFYALVVSGAEGRIMVRDWFESTVGEVVENLTQHFADLKLDARPREGEHAPPPLSLVTIGEALAAPTRNRQEGIPAPLQSALIRAVLNGSPYPVAALHRAVQRYRMELGRRDEGQDAWRVRQWNEARAAVIKAVLNRNHRLRPQAQPWKETLPAMDTTNRTDGYVLGRLMAVLERLQAEAQGNINATLIDRYFAGASASPRSVFPRLMKNARNHVRKLKEEKPGLVFRLERIIDDLAGPFEGTSGVASEEPSSGRSASSRAYTSNNFPTHLSLEQQGLFIIGYHQMRRWLWLNKEERAAWEADNPGAPKAYRWSKKTEDEDVAETTEA